MYKGFLKKIEEPLKGIFILIGVFTVINFFFNVFIEYIKINYQNETITIINEAVGSDETGDQSKGGVDTVKTARDEQLSERESNGGSDYSSQEMEQKIKDTFSDVTAIKIAKAESGLNPKAKSTTDFTSDGFPFSVGLFQINLSVHTVGGLKCNEAFSGRDHESKVVNMQLYNQCVELASNPDINIETANKIYNGRGWSAWGAYTNGSYLHQ